MRNPDPNRYIVVGDRVTYNGSVPTLDGKSGTLIAFRSSAPGVRFGTPMGDVRFDHEPRRVRVVELRNLTPAGAKTMPNFKTQVSGAVTKLASATGNPKDDAVRALGVASELVRIGERDKKAAKKNLVGLGVLDESERKPGTERVYESRSFTIDAVTSEPRELLDETALRQALLSDGVPRYKVDRAFTASRTKAKAATSFKVEQKR